jgi:hypothetical protein
VRIVAGLVPLYWAVTKSSGSLPLSLVDLTLHSAEPPTRVISLCSKHHGPCSSQVGNIPAAPDPSELLCRMESVPRCQLSMMLLWEVYSNEAARILYPYNMLRNYALVQVRTAAALGPRAPLRSHAGRSA